MDGQVFDSDCIVPSPTFCGTKKHNLSVVYSVKSALRADEFSGIIPQLYRV